MPNCLRSAHDERLAHPINSSTAQRPLEPVIYGTCREKHPLAASPTLTFTNPRTTAANPSSRRMGSLRQASRGGEVRSSSANASRSDP
jgi:hypothetical protein